MAAIRVSSRRLLVLVSLLSLGITVLVFRSLPRAQTISVFRRQDRIVFGEEIPGENRLNLITDVTARPLLYQSMNSSRNDSIPAIIHQTWSSENIPQYLKTWVRSFVEVNPGYQYWFWSDEAALSLVKKKFPEYLSYYNKYPKAIQRADVMRYFVLYEFGGFYADMDISAVRPLEPLRRHPCIVSQEPWVHAKVYWGRKELLPCNAFLAAAPKHPFMKHLIQNIPNNFERNNIDDVMDKTGPMMLDRMLKEYRKTKVKNFSDFDRVYLAEPNLFHPRYDPNLKKRYIEGCRAPSRFHLSELERAECERAKDRQFRFEMPAEAYTDHHWMHAWIGGTFIRRINPSNFINIKLVVPACTNASEIVRNMP